MEQMMQVPAFLSPMNEADVWAIVGALVFIVLDVVFGIAKAAKSHELSSSVMREGLWHKAGFVGAIALAVMIEVGAEHVALGVDFPLVIPACVYLIANEILSIMESLCALSPSLAGTKLMALFAVAADSAGASAESADEKEKEE